MRHGLDLPFRRAAGHFIASSSNPPSQSAVTKNDMVSTYSQHYGMTCLILVICPAVCGWSKERMQRNGEHNEITCHFRKHSPLRWSTADQNLLAFTRHLASFVKRAADFIWFLLDRYLPHKSNLYSKYYLSGHGDMPKLKKSQKKKHWKGGGEVVEQRRKGKKPN